jgi:cyclophilin family peptidyl-prolyl cis-trans isomerase
LNGAVKTGPYYEGVIFHRVIGDFMSQSGSRNGQGTDGPGYRFRDEISPTLTHNRHVISMANSGELFPNTNGSQFFITDVATPWLDGLHTIFGNVVSGGSVVDAINAVPTDAGERPLTPVVIQSVQIRRVGTAAQAFNVNAWDLPVVSGLPGTLDVTPGGPVRYEVTPSNQRTFTMAHRSTDLQSWSKIHDRYEDAQGLDRGFLPLDTATAPRAFYQISQAWYPDALPRTMANRVLDVPFGGNQRLVFEIGANGQTGSGRYVLGTTTNPYTITATYVTQDLWQGEYIFETNIAILGIVTRVGNTTTNSLTGAADVYQFLNNQWTKIGTGTFTLTK